MNNRAITLSLLMATIALLFVSSYVTSLEEEQKKRFGTEVAVVVAKKDIREMQTINEEHLEFQVFPKKFLEPAAISFSKKEPEDKEVSKTYKELVGAIAIVPLKRGEQITFNKLADPSMKTGLSSQVSPGRRAISIPVNELSGISKLIKPGDRVDVIAILDTGNGKENKIAKTLLLDVIVLSVGRFINNNVPRILEPDPFGTAGARARSLVEDFSFVSVTVEVEPLQAQMLSLVLSSSDNTLSLSLRNNDDVDRTAVSPVMLADILGPDMQRVKKK